MHFLALLEAASGLAGLAAIVIAGWRVAMNRYLTQRAYERGDEDELDLLQVYEAAKGDATAAERQDQWEARWLLRHGYTFGKEPAPKPLASFLREELALPAYLAVGGTLGSTVAGVLGALNN